MAFLFFMDINIMNTLHKTKNIKGKLRERKSDFYNSRFSVKF
jgi:hypothetical protein